MRTRFNNRRGAAGLSACLVATLLIGLAIPAEAQAKKPTYDVQVLAIRATKSNKEVSPELKSIAKELMKLGYTGFKLEKKIGGKVPEGGTFSGALVGGYSIKVTPLSPDKKDYVKLKVEVLKREGGKDKPEITTTVSAKRGRYWLQNLPYPGAADDRLIIAVSAR